MTMIGVGAGKDVHVQWHSYQTRQVPEILALINTDNRLKPICHFDPKQIVKDRP